MYYVIYVLCRPLFIFCNTSSIWKFTCIHLNHNHPPDEDLSGHPAARHLSPDETEIALNALKTYSTPRETIALLRETNPGVILKARDINNIKVKRKREYIDGRSTIQALLETLESSNWVYNFRVNEKNQVINLMVARPVSVEMGRKYNQVLLMDCTYKTNKYKMPLLNVVRITPQNKSFFCFVFLKEENEGHYGWALQNI
jgi:hypothetical protein